MRVRKYISSYEEFTTENIEEKEIFVATNLAGRGTDLKISKNSIQNGGLHVILSFLPLNIRVEQQAYGRAGRKG